MQARKELESAQEKINALNLEEIVKRDEEISRLQVFVISVPLQSCLGFCWWAVLIKDFLP
jgi:hypothetical protein